MADLDSKHYVKILKYKRNTTYYQYSRNIQKYRWEFEF